MSSKNFRSDIDLNQNQLVQAIAEKLSGGPGAPQTGQFFYDTNDDTLKVYDGVAFKTASVQFAANVTERATLNYARGNFLYLSDNGSGEWEFSLCIDSPDGTYSLATFELLMSENLQNLIINPLPPKTIFRSIIIPPTLTADVDDYSPTGLEPAVLIQLDAGEGGIRKRISGIDSTDFSNGDMLYISNTSTTRSAVLRNNNGNSLAANRFLFSGDISIAANMGITLYYDGTSSKWRTISEFAS